jgi:hypothetical protein
MINWNFIRILVLCLLLWLVLFLFFVTGCSPAQKSVIDNLDTSTLTNPEKMDLATKAEEIKRDFEVRLAREKGLTQLQTLFVIGVVGGLICAGVCAYLKLKLFIVVGVIVSASCLAGTLFITALNEQTRLISYGVLGLLVVGAVFGIIVLVRAIKQFVEGADRLKWRGEVVPRDNEVYELFKASQLQSPSTQKLVKAIKKGGV